VRAFQFGIVKEVDGISACLGPVFFAFVNNAIAGRNSCRGWRAWLRHCCSLKRLALVPLGTACGGGGSEPANAYRFAWQWQRLPTSWMLLKPFREKKNVFKTGQSSLLAQRMTDS
jgi:hypothetical protein